jgi:hypothetical protein
MTEEHELRKEVIDEIKGIIHLDKDQDLIPITNVFWRQGGRSKTKMYRHPKEHSFYMLKQLKHDNKNHYNDYITEEAVMHVVNKYAPDILPKLLSYGNEVLSKEKIFLIEGISDAPNLQERMEKLEKKAVFTKDIAPALDIEFKFQDYFTKERIEEIEREMCRLSGGKISSIPELKREDCVRNATRAFLHYDSDGSLKNKAYSFLNYFFENYLVLPEYRKVIQHDGYPTQNLITRLVDAGSIKIGPCLIQYGCTLGHPEVYFKMDNKPETIRTAVGYILKQTQIKQNPDRLEAGLYAACIYGNLRLIDLYKKMGGDTRPFERAVHSQGAFFKKNDICGELFFKVLSKLK